jgi:RNA polymerase sigma-70 factor (ECF subfamily)
LPAPPEWNPEFLLLLKTHKLEITAAFRDALASLSSRNRNVLRYHFIEELTIDHIGSLYGVHRATAARWINHARTLLFNQTRDLFRRRISMSDGEFHRILILLESQIRYHLVQATSADPGTSESDTSRAAPNIA